LTVSTRLLTAAELMAAPTGIDWSSLGEDSTSGESAIEESNLLDAASDWIANELEQPLGIHATTQSEQAILRRSASMGAKVYTTRDGSLRFRCDTIPICSVLSLQYGYLPPPASYSALTTANLVLVGSYPQVQVIEDWSFNWTCAGAGAPGFTGGLPIVQCSYISGWPNAVLTAGVSPGTGVTLAVDTTLGMATAPYFTGQDNSRLTIYDSTNTEVVQVTAIVDATHVTVAQVANTHQAGVRLSSMPRDIRLAVIYAAIDIARERGMDAIVMGGSSGGGGRAMAGAEEAADRARVLLSPYRRIV
jgi:hypothetical protein